MGWRQTISPKRAWRGAIATSCFFILLGSYFSILSIHHIFFPWTKSDFKEYTGTLNGTPIFENGKNKSLKIHLKEVKEFEFTIDGDNYTVLKNTSGVGNLEDGDKVSLLVDKSQFQAKISKSILSTFIQRTINWKWIRVYEFKSEKNTILDFKDVLEELKHVSKFYLVFGVLCWLGSYLYLKYEYRIYLKSKLNNTANTK